MNRLSPTHRSGGLLTKETLMKYDNRSGSSARVALTGERSAIRTSDTRIRDSGKVQVGGIIKKLPVAPPSPATRDGGKVQVGGIIKKLPVTPPRPATRDAGKVQVGGIIKRLPVSRPSAAIQDPGMTRVGGIIRKSPKG